MIKRAAKEFLGFFGYDIIRRPICRFDAMADCLRVLRGQGFTPDVVIDAGANVGNWTRMACKLWPTASYHLIEPQPACRLNLESLKLLLKDVCIYPVAVTRPGISEVRLMGAGAGSSSTGAWVLKDASAQVRTDTGSYRSLSVAATTLDALFADRVRLSERVLLKMDLENHEPEALRGALQLLKKVEVVISEVGFIDPPFYKATFDGICKEMQAANFALFDVASLNGRSSDMRLQSGDVVFANHESALLRNRSWI